MPPQCNNQVYANIPCSKEAGQTDPKKLCCPGCSICETYNSTKGQCVFPAYGPSPPAPWNVEFDPVDLTFANDEYVLASTTVYNSNPNPGSQEVTTAACGDWKTTFEQLQRDDLWPVATPTWMASEYLGYAYLPTGNSFTPPEITCKSCSSGKCNTNIQRNWTGKWIYNNCKQLGAKIPGGCDSCYEIQLVDIASSQQNNFDFEKYRDKTWTIIVTNNCEMYNTFGNNNNWCVPMKSGPPKQQIYNSQNKNASSVVCGAVGSNNDCNRIGSKDLTGQQTIVTTNDVIVAGQWHDNKWTANECGPLNKFRCRNLAGFAAHFDFEMKAPWGNINAVVKAKPTKCPLGTDIPSQSFCAMSCSPSCTTDQICVNCLENAYSQCVNCDDDLKNPYLKQCAETQCNQSRNN